MNIPGGKWLITSLLVVVGLSVAAFVMLSGPIAKLLASVGLRLPSSGAAGGTLFMVGRNGKWGYVDAQGREVIPFQYAEPPATKIGSDIVMPRLVFRRAPPYPVYRDGKWSLVDENGKSVASRPLDEISAGGGSVEPIICGRSGTTWGCVNALGRDVVAFDNEAAFGPFPNGFVSIKRNAKWGSVDSSGKILIEPRFQTMTNFVMGSIVSMVEFEDGRFGLIDRYGNEVGKNRYEKASTPSEEIWPVFTNGHWALANFQGVVTRDLDPSISYVGTFGGGLADAKTNEKSGYMNGYIDISGKWAIPPTPRQFNQIYGSFLFGLATYGVRGSVGLMGRDGKYVLPPIFQSTNISADGLILARHEDETWLLDKLGHVIWPSEKRSLDPPTSDPGKLYESQWQFLRDSLSSQDAGDVWEFSENGLKSHRAGEMANGVFKITKTSPPQMVLQQVIYDFQIFDDLMAVWPVGGVSFEGTRRIMVFKRVGESSYAKNSGANNPTAPSLKDSLLSRLPHFGGGSVIGRWQGDGKEFEFFEDNTVTLKGANMGFQPDVTIPGNWIQLSDGRIKIDITYVGMKLPPIFAVMKSGELAVTGDILTGGKLSLRMSRAN